MNPSPFTYQLDVEYQARCSVWSDIVDHLPALHDAVASRDKPTVVELGTRSGNSTAALLRAADTVGGHVWSVDIEPPGVPGWWADTGLWTVVVGDDLHPAVLAQLPERIDVLFIDTSHTYDQTLEELRVYVPRVQPGGVVLLHDTELDGPDRSFLLPGGTDVAYPVAAALDDYCAETGREWTNTTGCYGLGRIEVS